MNRSILEFATSRERAVGAASGMCTKKGTNDHYRLLKTKQQKFLFANDYEMIHFGLCSLQNRDCGHKISGWAFTFAWTITTPKRSIIPMIALIMVIFGSNLDRVAV